MHPMLTQPSDQRWQLRVDHRFATGQDHMLTTVLLCVGEDLVNFFGIAFRIPRSVGRIAKPASQIAAAGADKNARDSGESPFALDAMENFGDSNHRLGQEKQNMAWILAAYNYILVSPAVESCVGRRNIVNDFEKRIPLQWLKVRLFKTN
jgi:hypothetical protein